MAQTIIPIDDHGATTCRRCNEAVRRDEPCGCERALLRWVPPATATSLTFACDDRQHYACPGYVGAHGGAWRRCGCGCHRGADSRA